MKPHRPLIAVVGDAAAAPGSPAYVLGEEIGALLVAAGFRVVTGGLGGVMEAASKGARQSPQHRDGDVVALLPGNDPAAANEFVDIAIPTGLDHARNLLVARTDALIAIGGGAGTLSEIAHAWMEKRLIIALRVSGWSAELADRRLDARVRYPEIADDRIYGVFTAREAVETLQRHLPQYGGVHRGIARRSPAG